ncbi:hypothetical protein DICA0_B10396 [Diutina catenulata]
MPFETNKETRDRRVEEYQSVMTHAAVRGVLQGTLAGLVTGWFLNYRYNHGHNVRFFRPAYKVAYVVCWNVVAMSWTMDEAKYKLRKQLLVENQLRQDEYLEKEFYVPRHPDGPGAAHK